MSVYQTNITSHSPNLKYWREGLVNTLSFAKDTQIQLERTLGKAHDYPHDPRKRSDRELYLPHHPVVNPNKPGDVRRVLLKLTAKS